MKIYLIPMCTLLCCHAYDLLSLRSRGTLSIKNLQQRLPPVSQVLHLLPDKVKRTQSEKIGNSFNSNEDVWLSRRKIIRSAVKPVIKSRLDKLEKGDPNSENESKDKYKNGLVLSSALVAMLALVLRFGGRLAFVRLLGLDMFLPSADVAEGAVLSPQSELNQQIDSFLTYFSTLGGFQYAGFFGAWLIAKILCLDPLTIVLAFSSGILFGGLWQGTAASVLCSSTASLITFLFSRYALREKAKEEISKRPTFRAVDRACSKQGFKTVFTLRISPILPIPIGAYNYIYGASSVSVLDFIAGITLGSIKPYLLDSYLGLFGKSILDQQASSQEDIFLLVFISLIILVGTYASQIAAEAWTEIQEEAKIDPTEFAMQDTGSMYFGIDNQYIPSALQSLEKETKAAWGRISQVINDEAEAVELETKNGISLGWDGVTTLVEDAPVPSKASSDGIERMDYSYPGYRTIYDFELVTLDGKSFGKYTLESLLFSFVLLSALFNDKIGEKASTNSAGTKTSQGVAQTLR